MRDTQPPITSEEEYYGYKLGRDKLTKVVEEREARLIDALTNGDSENIEARRFDLLQMLRKRQGIIDAIRVYEQQTQQQSA